MKVAVREAITVTVDVVSSAGYLWPRVTTVKGKQILFPLQAPGNMEIARALPHHNDHDSLSPKARLWERVIICFNSICNYMFTEGSYVALAFICLCSGGEKVLEHDGPNRLLNSYLCCCFLQAPIRTLTV